MKYRIKTPEVDAFYWSADVHQMDEPTWLNDALRNGEAMLNKSGKVVWMTFRDSYACARPGDYLIRSEDGSMYAIDGAVFRATYEEVKDEPAQDTGCKAMPMEYNPDHYTGE